MWLIYLMKTFSISIQVSFVEYLLKDVNKRQTKQDFSPNLANDYKSQVRQSLIELTKAKQLKFEWKFV